MNSPIYLQLPASPCRWAALVITAALSSGACTSRSYPPLALQHQLVATGEALDATQIGQMLRATPALPATPRVALAMLDSADGGSQLNERDRSALIEALRRQMDTAPFASVVTLPTAPSHGYRDGGGPPLDELRSAAARFQTDLLVLVTTAATSYRRVNPLAITYFAVVPMFFVPGTAVSVYASAEACALDVRSGIFLSCASGRDAAEESLVPLAYASDVLPELSQRDLQGATRELPHHLSAAIYDHVGTASYRRVGRRYETPIGDD